MTQLVKPLRICRECGLKAYTAEDLELFKKHADHPHGRDTLCKKCFNEYRKHRRDTNDRVYLLHKFKNLKNRCCNPNHTLYPRYGARGITVCDEWLNDPDSFVHWAFSSGWRRELQIDRIDNEGSYSPDNCRWSTRVEQLNNRRNTTTFPEKGIRICSKCKIEKPLTDFHRDASKPQGRKHICKECRQLKSPSEESE